MSEPLNLDLVIRKGRDFELVAQLLAADGNPVDLTAATLAMQIREGESAASALIATCNVEATDAANGWVKATLANAATAVVAHTEGFYDLMTTISGVKDSWLAGKVTFKGMPTA